MPSPAKPTGFLPEQSRAGLSGDSRSLLNRLACVLVIAGWMSSLQGCIFGRLWLPGRHDHMASLPRPTFSTDPQMEEVVDHLNRNVGKLHAWKAHTVRIRANNMPLSGTLAVEEGQHLRLVVNSLAGHEVDMGSNDDVFWIWAKRMEPSYVFCRHEQIDTARETLGVPFEPQWLMQALGVARLDTQGLTMQIDPTGQHARLVQPVISAHGLPMQKVMQVDLVHGIVTEHCIYDSHGAKIARAQLEDFRLDSASGVVLPHRVKLEWPQNQMSLVMSFGNVEINPKTIPSQIWDMPQMPGVQMVDLGKNHAVENRKQPRPGIQFAARETEPAVRLKEPEDIPADDDVGRVSLNLDLAEDEDDRAAGGGFDRSTAVAPVEHQTLPIERPAKAVPPAKPDRSAKPDWWDN